jgi:hypothetical protein
VQPFRSNEKNRIASAFAEEELAIRTTESPLKKTEEPASSENTQVLHSTISGEQAEHRQMQKNMQKAFGH